MKHFKQKIIIIGLKWKKSWSTQRYTWQFIFVSQYLSVFALFRRLSSNLMLLISNANHCLCCHHFVSRLVNMGNCGSFDPDDEFSYHPDEWCDKCNCPKPPPNQVCLNVCACFSQYILYIITHLTAIIVQCFHANYCGSF